MGFTERCDSIPPDFNDVDSWQEVMMPCCHCRTFQGDRPLKKKLRKCLSHHDAGLAEPYRCDTLWEICHVPLLSKLSKNSSKKTPVKVEEKDVSSVPLQKKKRRALTRIGKEVLALDAKTAHSASHSYVQSLEDCTKNHAPKGTNRKYLAEKLATEVPTAYGGLCATLLQGHCADKIKKSNPYRDAMEVCRVLDMGSGQLNISGIDLLRKGIEGDTRGKVERNGG